MIIIPDHDLQTITECSLHPSQLPVVDANIAAGQAVALCECGVVITGSYWSHVVTRHQKHLMAVISRYE